jgi:hypothetical protein
MQSYQEQNVSGFVRFLHGNLTNIYLEKFDRNSVDLTTSGIITQHFQIAVNINVEMPVFNI